MVNKKQRTEQRYESIAAKSENSYLGMYSKASESTDTKAALAHSAVLGTLKRKFG